MERKRFSAHVACFFMSCLRAAVALAPLLLFLASSSAEAKVLELIDKPYCPRHACESGMEFWDLFQPFWFAFGAAAWMRSGWLLRRAATASCKRLRLAASAAFWLAIAVLAFALQPLFLF